MARLPIPDALVMALALGSVALVMSSGVRWGVGRKARTVFHGQAHMEDSVEGARWRGGGPVGLGVDGGCGQGAWRGRRAHGAGRAVMAGVREASVGGVRGGC